MSDWGRPRRAFRKAPHFRLQVVRRPTELVIEPGMTGIVGPNGCGKSNIVEALRWVMGESSAKKMRGDDMDDVIFGGTDKRPARNIAEVCLGVDNTTRTAPAGFNDFDELDIQRKINGVPARTTASTASWCGRAMCSCYSPTTPAAPIALPWSVRAVSAPSSIPNRPSGGCCWRKPPASPACTPAGTRPSFA